MKSFHWLTKNNFLIVIGLVALVFLYSIRGVLISFFLAAVIAYFLYPLVAYLENRRGLSRLIAILIAYLVVAILFLLLFMYIIPLLTQELSQLIGDIPYYTQELEKLINRWQPNYQQALTFDINQRLSEELVNRGEVIVIGIARKTTQILVWLATSLANLIIGLILAFYLLRDFHQIKHNMITLFPNKQRENVLIFWGEINQVIEGFIRGQLLVALFVACFLTLGLYWLEIKYALIIGLVAGIAGIIPYLGSIIGILPALILALLKSPWLALKVLVLFIIIQQLEGSVISPKIVGDRVGLHPLVIILSLLAGGQFLGIWGMLIAVPLAAIIKVFLTHLWIRLPDK